LTSGAYTPGYLSTLGGTTATDGNPAYTAVGRGVYITVRKADESSTTPVQPGATQNWAQAFFVGGTIANPNAPVQPLIESGAAGLLLKEAGFTPAYKSCGVNPASC
jgi:hypothetical protein